MSDFTAKFGQQIILHPDLAFGNQVKDYRAVARVGNVREDNTVIENMNAAQYWHQDGDFWQPRQNFIINFLYGVEIPPKGGNTGFKDTQTALKKMDPAIVDKMKGAYVDVLAREISDFQKAGPENIPPDARHQVIFEHPFSREPQVYALTPIPGMNMVCRDGSKYAFTQLHEEINKVAETVQH